MSDSDRPQLLDVATSADVPELADTVEYGDTVTVAYRSSRSGNLIERTGTLARIHNPDREYSAVRVTDVPTNSHKKDQNGAVDIVVETRLGGGLYASSIGDHRVFLGTVETFEREAE